jgi:hypothetical protein
MAATTIRRPTSRLSGEAAVFVALSVAHGLVLLAVPSAALVAILLWWNANTIAHNFIHRPFFRSRPVGRAYEVFLSVLLGVPLSLWRARHLAHHAVIGGPSGAARSVRPTGAMWTEGALILATWALAFQLMPARVVTVYLPGYLAGLVLCWLQGHFEHLGGTTSHYGEWYNVLFFNDGYHVEHHARPHLPWTALPQHVQPDTRVSRWPPVLRWLDARPLDLLEHLVVRSTVLQRCVLGRHEAAFRALLPAFPAGARVTIVGGGLYPRTAIVLRRLLPAAALTVVDMRQSHLDAPRPFLDPSVRLECRRYDPARAEAADLVIVPLALSGDRSIIYRRPNAPVVLIHDWIWARHQPTARISWLLLKRLNVVGR